MQICGHHTESVAWGQIQPMSCCHMTLGLLLPSLPSSHCHLQGILLDDIKVCVFIFSLKGLFESSSRRCFLPLPQSNNQTFLCRTPPRSPVCDQSNVQSIRAVLLSLRMLIAILMKLIDKKQHLTHLRISPLERKIVPSFSQPSVPSLLASLATADGKLSVPQSPPPSPVKSPLEVRLYPQPYFQTRTQHQAQQLKKIEPPLQSPIQLKPKVVSTALVRFLPQGFNVFLAETVKVSWLQSAHTVWRQNRETLKVFVLKLSNSTFNRRDMCLI